ncbi:MAG: Mg2+ and Co2+ transporter CorB [Clostridiales bacterium]|nr:Mg2+ and Co2+ transporter CorB [Eubacteriales bacterium]MDH7565226.1 Mg2+ and Co2+ transporter CorB [Clostridiales bacterium]
MGADGKHPYDEKKVKFRVNMLGSQKNNTKWIITITTVSFLLSASLSFASSNALKNVNNVFALLIVLVIIFIGIIFDMVGIAVTAADEAPFHAMASRKMYGAKQAIKLIRNANKVSSFCNDVVGDIAGVISGTASAIIIVKITGSSSGEITLAGLAITALVASITVGGKALGKTIAIHNSNYITYRVGVMVSFFTGKIPWIRLKRNNKKI